MSNHNLLSGKRLKRVAAFVPAWLTVLLIAACGGSSTPTTASGVQNAAFISNTYSGNLQIVDTQNDTTAFTQQTTNSAGQVVPGAPVTVAVSTTVTFEVESPNKTTTLVYDPSSFTLWTVTNSTDATSGELSLAGPASMALFSPDSSTVYVPVPSAAVSGGHRFQSSPQAATYYGVSRPDTRFLLWLPGVTPRHWGSRRTAAQRSRRRSARPRPPGPGPFVPSSGMTTGIRPPPGGSPRSCLTGTAAASSRDGASSG